MGWPLTGQNSLSSFWRLPSVCFWFCSLRLSGMASALPSNWSRVLIRTRTMQPGLRKTHARVTLQFKIKAKKRWGNGTLRLEIAKYKCLKTYPMLATNLDTCLEKEIVSCISAGRKVLRVDGTTLNGHRHVFWSAAVKCPSPEIFVGCFSFLKWHWMSLYECFGLRPKCLRAICPSTCRMRRSHDAQCDLSSIENISNCKLHCLMAGSSGNKYLQLQQRI